MMDKLVIRKNRKGATLVEVLLSCAIYSILMISLFLIMRYSINNWRSIEDRTDIQTQLRRLDSLMSDEIEKTSFSSVVIYKGDYRHSIAFKSFIDPATGRFDTNNEGIPISHGYILYTVLRPADDPCTHLEYNVRDTKCPHKIILRVELTKNTNDGINYWDPVVISTSTALRAYLPSITGKSFSSSGITINDYVAAISGDSKYIRRVDIICNNIVDFSAERIAPPQIPGILVTASSFKFREASRQIQVGQENLLDSRFTIKMETKIIPQNF